VKETDGAVGALTGETLAGSTSSRVSQRLRPFECAAREYVH
jgi:hypothetical protein